MLQDGRYETLDEMEALFARARRMRSDYVAVLVTRASLRAKQFFARAADRRYPSAARYYPDVG